LGDDLLIGFNKLELDFESFSKIIKKRFDMDIELEMDMSSSGTDVCFFLGSKWISGVPIREESHLVASVCFGSGNFPKMSQNLLFQSRFFEVFGNSGDCGKYWKRFNLPISDRLYFFNELSSPHKFGTSKRRLSQDKSSKKDVRGYWFSTDFNIHTIDSLWRNR
jgi:hypothetical protein